MNLDPATARAAARQRPAPIELMNALLFSLPGTPVIYYGDEIGMGDNIYLGDRTVSDPMQWNQDRNAGLGGQPAAPVPARGGSREPPGGGERRGAAEQPDVAAVVDAG